MIDLWVTQIVLHGWLWAYVVPAVALLAIAIWLPRRLWPKVGAAALVLLVASWIPFRGYQEHRQTTEARKVATSAYLAAKAVFDDLCKSAGEQIVRRHESVAGVRLMNVRAMSTPAQLTHNAVKEVGDEGYIRSFLVYENERVRGYSRVLSFGHTITPHAGYEFVEIMDEGTQTLHRYSMDSNWELRKEKAAKPLAKFGVAFNDPVVPEHRRIWIASSTVTVTDLSTQEVIAVSVRHVMDPAQGRSEGGRDPWAFAHGCGRSEGYGPYYTRFFVDQVLNPRRESMREMMVERIVEDRRGLR